MRFLRILITGATGFIGTYLVRALAPNHEVVCLVRRKKGLAAVSDFDVVEGDLLDSGLFQRLPPRVDSIIHLAQSNTQFPEEVRSLFTVNAASTASLADYARRAGVATIVYASSGSVYGEEAATLREDLHCRPTDFYALTKHVSEQILECYAPYLSISILRLFAPYGPNQTGRMIPNIVARVQNGHPVVLTNGGEPRVNPIFVSDVVEAFEQSLTLNGYHVVNVAGPDVVNIGEIAELAGVALGRTPRFEHRNQAQHVNLVGDTARFQEVFDLPVTVRIVDGMKMLVDSLD